MAPLFILTGMVMSPALANHPPSYTQSCGGRQSAPSIRFLVFAGFVVFVIVHVALIALTGFGRYLIHIVLGTDNQRPAGHDPRLDRRRSGGASRITGLK